MQCSSARASILAHIPQWLVAVLLISGSVALQAAVPPIITGINPNRGAVGGGTVVIISGEGFTGTTSVTFGGAAAGFTVNNDNQITATTPAQTAGVYDVVVTTPESSATLTDGFSYGNVPATRADEYSTPFNTPLRVFAPGVLSNDNDSGGGTMTAELIVGPSNGTLVFNADGSFTYTPNTGFSGTETLKYRAINAAGNGNTVSITITIAVPTTAQPATGLFVLSIVNNEVTFRWTPPVTGLAPTDYILEAGAGPGAVQGSVSTGSTFPIFTFTAPTGALFYRIRTVSGSSISGPSNEIQVFVNVPVVPSPPADLVGLVNGSSVALAWRNTFGGGPPTGLVLDVTGSIATSIPLGLSDSFNFANVPSGTYTLALRATNASGSGAQSNPVTLTFPGPCSGAPLAPSNFLAYRIGNLIKVLWDPATTGPAPTAYVLTVGGAFVGTFPTTGRQLMGTVGAGSYNFNVTATNACGASPATATQTVVVP